MVDELEPYQESTADLLRDAIAEVKELTKLEVALAKDEAITEVKELKGAAIAFAVAGLCAFLGIVCVVVAIALAIGSWVLSLVIAAVLFAVASLGAFFGAKHLPRKPLWSTRQRLESDVRNLKEHVA